MGERTSYTPGTFCWVDLVTKDQEGARDFYGALCGWDFEDLPTGDGRSYSMAHISGRNVAAIAPLPDQSMPPHWNCYVSVEDADATAVKARDLGAGVLAEPFDVFDSGRMTVFQDPQGAVLSAWQPKENIGANLVNEIGALCWNDLITPDVKASSAFYAQLFGWDVSEASGSEGRYFSIINGGAPNGGMMPLPPGGHPAWNLYFAVIDTGEALAQVDELGGSTVMGPIEVPSGRFAIVRDPQGVVFSIVDGRLDP